MTATTNSLNQVQSYQLMKWLDNNQQLIQKKSAHAIAEIAQSELKFHVTASNIQNKRLALGLGPGSAHGLRGRKIKERSTNLARAVHNLYVSLSSKK